jgi:hypothetical protein
MAAAVAAVAATTSTTTPTVVLKKRAKAAVPSRYQSRRAMMFVKFSPDPSRMPLECYLCPEMEPLTRPKWSLGSCSIPSCGTDSTAAFSACAHSLRNFELDQSGVNESFVRYTNQPHDNWMAAVRKGCAWLSPAPFPTSHVERMEILSVPFDMIPPSTSLTDFIAMAQASMNTFDMKIGLADIAKYAKSLKPSEGQSHHWYVVNASVSHVDTDVPFSVSACLTSTVWPRGSAEGATPITKEWPSMDGIATTPLVACGRGTMNTLTCSVEPPVRLTPVLTPIKKGCGECTTVFSANCVATNPWTMRALSMDFDGLTKLVEDHAFQELNSFMPIAAPVDTDYILRQGAEETKADQNMVVLQWLTVRFADYFTQEIAEWHRKASRDTKDVYASEMKRLGLGPATPVPLMKERVDGGQLWFIIPTAAMFALLDKLKSFAAHDTSLVNATQLGLRVRMITGDARLAAKKKEIGDRKARGASADVADPYVHLTGMLTIAYVPWSAPPAVRTKLGLARPTETDIATAKSLLEISPEASTAGRPGYTYGKPRAY